MRVFTVGTLQNVGIVGNRFQDNFQKRQKLKLDTFDEKKKDNHRSTLIPNSLIRLVYLVSQLFNTILKNE